jgi:hypothetical protein
MGSDDSPGRDVADAAIECLFSVQRSLPRNAAFAFSQKAVQFAGGEVAESFLLIDGDDRGGHDVLWGGVVAGFNSLVDGFSHVGREGESHMPQDSNSLEQVALF